MTFYQRTEKRKEIGFHINHEEEMNIEHIKQHRKILHPYRKKQQQQPGNKL